MKGYEVVGDVIVINRELTELDIFLKDFLNILKKYSGYLVVSGFVSIATGRTKGYPISLAGLVPAHVTNENGNIMPGDLLVSSSKPGYAMKNDNPKDGTVVGKAFDFCDEKDCKIPVFVALS